jgi:Right handed beta helix region
VGDVSYVLPAISVPAIPVGSYRIAIGLYDPVTGARTPLSRVSGDLYTADIGFSRYDVGVLNVTGKRIVDANVVCNGVTDVSRGLRDAFDRMQAGDLLRLPAGTCVYSTVSTPPPDNCTNQDPLPLKMPYGLTNVAVVGRGMPSTVLKALNVDASALFADHITGLQIRDFTLSAETAGVQRRTCPIANGLSVFNSSTVDINRVLISKTAAAGMLLYGVQDGNVRNSRVQGTLADGIQATQASRRVTVSRNYIADTGDDSVSSIGYVPHLNESITVTNNTSINSGASGVSVEGTSTATVSGNLIERSRVAGLRFASIAAWQTGAVNSLTATNNTLNGVRWDTTVDHAAVMIFADYGNVSNVTLSGNRINSPKTVDGVRVRGSFAPSGATQFWASNVTVSNNVLTNAAPGTMSKCLTKPWPATVSNLMVSGNTLNGASCPVTY